MADPETIGGVAGGGGLLGAFFAWLLKGKLEDKIDLKQSIRQCDKNHEDIKEMFKEIKSDIKMLDQKFDTYRSVRDLDK